MGLFHASPPVLRLALLLRLLPALLRRWLCACRPFGLYPEDQYDTNRQHGYTGLLLEGGFENESQQPERRQERQQRHNVENEEPHDNPEIISDSQPEQDSIVGRFRAVNRLNQIVLPYPECV